MIKKEIHGKVLAAFKKEYKEHLKVIREVLTQKEGNSLPSPSIEKAGGRAHTLKGAAKAANLPLVQNLVLQLEVIFKRIKNRELILDSQCMNIIESLLNSIDAYSGSLDDNNNSSMEKEVETALQKVRKFLNLESTEQEVDIPPDNIQVSGKREKILEKVFQVFQQEYKIHLESLRDFAALAGKNKTPSLNDIDEAFRTAHTLKGAARAVDIPVVQTLAHRLETLFSGIKGEKIKFNKGLTEIINACLDAIEDYVELLSEKGRAFRPSEPNTLLKRINDFLGIKTPDIDPGIDPGDGIAGGNKETPNQFSHLGEPNEDFSSSKMIDTLRIKTESMGRIGKTVGQILTENRHHIKLAQQIGSLENLIEDMSNGWLQTFKTAHQQIRRLESDADFSKISGYINLVNHHTQQISRILHNLKKTQQNFHQSSSNLGEQLKEDLLNARIVPGESVFQVFRKMVRDLARDQEKKIDFLVEGLHIQADRMVFQSLKDPVMHMLRNAVSHGIELPEQRKLAGKEETGKIRFYIEIKDNRLHITIEDDGRGLDIDSIVTTAVKNKVLSSEQARTMNSREILNLIFQPGFSTASEVTELTGRGMGMSVVKEILHRLQGDIDIDSEPSNGTCITLSVPLTILSQQLLLMKVNRQIFGTPTLKITRLLRIKKEEVELLDNKPVIMFNGRPIPLFNLADLLDLGNSTLTVRQRQIPVMVIESNDINHFTAIAVEEFVGETEAIIHELPRPLNRHPYYHGGFLQIDGTVVLIINPSQLANKVFSKHQHPFPILIDTNEEEKQRERSKILVVDDSITTRTLEKTILDAQGYDVFVAVDGFEAMQFLNLNPVDLVITDVAMPRMDGFQLVEEMKRNRFLRDLPVIIVSSLDRKEDRERGLAVGADAYVVKQKFEQQNLLEVIRQII